jgi:hypothetical protein
VAIVCVCVKIDTTSNLGSIYCTVLYCTVLYCNVVVVRYGYLHNCRVCACVVSND